MTRRVREERKGEMRRRKGKREERKYFKKFPTKSNKD